MSSFYPPKVRSNFLAIEVVTPYVALPSPPAANALRSNYLAIEVVSRATRIRPRPSSNYLAVEVVSQIDGPIGHPYANFLAMEVVTPYADLPSPPVASSLRSNYLAIEVVSQEPIPSQRVYCNFMAVEVVRSISEIQEYTQWAHTVYGIFAPSAVFGATTTKKVYGI